MRNFNISVDIDGVCLDTVGKIEAWGGPRRDRWKTWEGAELNVYEKQALSDCFRARHFWRGGFELVPGAKDALWELDALGVEIEYVTTPSVVMHGEVELFPNSAGRLADAGFPHPERVAHQADKTRLRTIAVVDDRPATIQKILAYRREKGYPTQHVYQFHAQGYAEDGLKWAQILQRIKGALNEQRE